VVPPPSTSHADTSDIILPPPRIESRSMMETTRSRSSGKVGKNVDASAEG
jgi:hypothetical protein